MSFLNLTVLCHGRTICDDFIFPEEEFRAREKRARELMEQKGLDGLLIFAEGAIDRAAICYLTNYHQFLSWGCAVLVFPRDGDFKLVSTIPPRDKVFVQKALPPFVEIIPAGLNLTSNEHVCMEAIKYMREQGLLEGKKWGTVNLERMPQVAVEPWLEIYPQGLENCTEDFGKLRSVKSACEIYAMSAGSAIAKTAVCDYLRQAVPGGNESVLAAEIDRQARIKGCESVSLLTYSGKDGPTMLRVPWDRDFEDGDTVSVFAHVSYLRYYGAYGATKVIGTPGDDYKALGALASGLWADKLAEMERTGSAAIGYEEKTLENVKVYTVVNGTGMDLVDYPGVQGETAEIAENMAFTVSLSAYKPGVGSVFHSESFARTPDGLRALSGLGK